MTDMQYGPRKPGYYGAYSNTGDDRSNAVMPEAMARELAEKYDVGNLSRNEYSLLLCGLRNAGFITTQEFSAGYGGTLPHGAMELPEPLPLGDNKADFTALLAQYVRYCGGFLEISARSGPERAHAKSLLTTYSRLDALFRQIHGAASETN